MADKVKITNDNCSAIVKHWYRLAEGVTVNTLEDFIVDMRDNYIHTISSAHRMVEAAGLATCHATSKVVGMTDLALGFVGETIYKELASAVGPTRVQQLKHMLYPQHQHMFDTLSKTEKEWLICEARKLLMKYPDAAEVSVSHWSKMANHGVLPFGFKTYGNR